ncbi:MAG TPA: SGNH/GDSL hydrolase family protein [Chitinispirillaceae bacterium]|nr:SGNH/GDSL hydrolase family protein [Chitinispirillaceae bacterium]
MHNLKSYFVKMTFACLFMVFTMYAQKPQLKSTDLAINGESVFAMTDIPKELSKLAREDGVLTSGDFKMIAVSGQPINTIIDQFKNCNPKPKYLVTDGGGIDLSRATCQAGDENCSAIKSCKQSLLKYIDEMKKAGVKAFVWMGYPEAPGANYKSLTINQAIWTTVTKKVIAEVTEPKAIYVDMLPVFEGHYNEYFPSYDGLHPNSAGSKAAAKAFWDAMKADNFAFFDTGKVSVSKPAINSNRAISGHILSQVMKSGNLSVSLSVDQPSDISLRLTTASGRSVFTAQRHAAVSGKQDVVFQTGGLARGVYCCEIRTGKQISQSALLVH